MRAKKSAAASLDGELGRGYDAPPAAESDQGSNEGSPTPAEASERPDSSVDRARNGGVGTAYRIRTGDLRLERAVSWASRRMRRSGNGGGRRRRGEGYQRPREASTGASRLGGTARPASGAASVRAGASRGRSGSPRRPAGDSAPRRPGRSASAPRTARTRHRAIPPAAPRRRG